MGLELSTANGERNVTELLYLKQLTQVIRESALWHLELYSIALARDVHTVRHNAHLQNTWWKSAIVCRRKICASYSASIMTASYSYGR